MSLIARYTASASGVVPTFNNGYQYAVNETESDGIYTVELSSDTDFTSCSFNGNTNLLTVEYLNVTSSVTDMSSMFRGCSQLTQLDVSNFNTSNVTTMEMMFRDCNNLTSIDLSNFDTTNTTDMDGLFYSCDNLTNINISNWDLNNITDFTEVFYETSYLRSITMQNSDYSSVNKIISQLPTRTSDSMGTLDIEGIDDISQVNTTTAETKFWNIENGIKIEVAKYKFDNTIYDLFPEFNKGFTYTYEDVVEGEVTIRTIYSDSLPTKISFGQGHTEAQPRELSLLGVEYLNITSATSTIYNLFARCQNLQYVNGVNDWDISGISDLTTVFYHCHSLTQIDLSNWDTSNVTDMYCMFRSCNSLTTLDVSNFDTSKVTRMDHMFRDCNKLTSLDLNNFITNNVTNMRGMFRDCNKLTSLVLGNGFNMDNVTNIDYIFSGCNNLILLIVPNATVSMKLDDNLPTRTADSPGTLIVTGDKYNLDTKTPESKYWNISDKYKIAEYKFDGSLYNLIPDFNDGFIYTYEDKMEGNMIAANTNWESGVPNISTGIVEPYGDFPTAKTSDFIEVNPSTTYYTGTLLSEEGMEYNINVLCWYWYDENKTYIDGVIDEPSVVSPANASFLRVCIEESNLEYNGWTLNNVYVGTNTTSTITRTIYSDSLPTLMRFGTDTLYTDDYVKGSEVALISIEYLDTSNLTTCYNMFKRCTSLVSINTDGWNTSNVTTMQSMFAYCNKLTTLNGDQFNTTNVTNMKAMFDNCVSLTTLDISNWDTSNVTDMSYMFFACETLIDLDISKWDTSNVTDMSYMFCYCNLLPSLDLSGWNTSNVIDMECVFYACQSLTTLNVSDWDTSKVEDMQWMFGFYDDDNDTMSLTSIIGLENWDTSNVTNMEGMFCHCRNLTELNLSNWDTGNVTNMFDMFLECNALTSVGDLTNWDVSNVTNMAHMFYGCNKLTSLDVSNFDTSNVTSMGGMFYGCKLLTSLDVSNWVTSNVTNMAHMFNGCNLLTSLDVSNFDTNNVTNMSWMFNGCKSLTSLDVSKFDTSKVTTMTDMFWKCESLTTLDVSNWDTSNVTDMYDIFCRCYELNSIIGIEDWDVSNVTNMTDMFYGCKISELDLSNWDTGKVTDMTYMFSDCYMLQTLNVTGWDTSNVTNMDEMFSFYEIGCHNLRNIIGLNTWDTSNVTSMYCMFWECRSLESLDLSNWNTRNVTDMSWMFCDCESLETLKLDGWYINENTTYNDLFSSYEYDGCKSLTSISMNNSDYNSVNKIITQLPTRTSDSMGTLDVRGVDDITQVDTSTAESKFWNIKNKIKIAEYKFDKSIYENLIPEFNEGFTYTYEDSSIMDGFVTRKLYAAENDFVDISKCISRNKTVYDSGIYAGTGIVDPAPMFLDDEILFRGHEWDSLNIDLSDYQGKEINISFTIEHFANQWSELNVGIELYDDTHLDDYSGVIYEDCLSENLIKEYSVTWTIPNEKCRLYLGGMYLELSNINIMIEDYNLFPNHILTEYDYVNTLGFKVNKPSLYDNKLAFSHYWNGFNIEFGQFKGKEATISFDIEEIANSYDHSQCEIYIPQTVQVPLNDHYSNTFIIESDHIYIGGNGIKITNLQILVDNRTTEETINNLPTLMRFGAAGESNSKSQSLLEVNYLNTDNLDTMYCMFDECNNVITINTENFNTSNVTDMNAMFYECNNLTSIDISNFDTSNVTDMNNMFYKCAKLTSLDVSNFDTSNVNNMYYMFGNCNNLTSLDVSNFDTSKVTRMDCMFYGCAKLTSIDISGFDTSKVTRMNNMFYKCAKLTSIDISGFDTSKVTDMSNMFNTCSNLTYIEMQNSDYNSVNKIIAELPTRTTDSIGILNITGVDDISQVDTATAQSKYWNISTLKQYKIHLITVNNEKVKKIHNQNKKLKISIYKY